MFNLMKRRAAQPMAGGTEFNQSIRYQINSMGDDGTATRHILHYAYPDEDQRLQKPSEIRALARKHGLTHRDAAHDGGFVFEHHREVASTNFDRFTAEFAVQLRELGYDYDGWECAVVLGDDGTDYA